MVAHSCTFRKGRRSVIEVLNHILGIVIWHTLATLITMLLCWLYDILREINEDESFIAYFGIAYIACGAIVIVMFLVFWSVRFIFGAVLGETFYDTAIDCIETIKNIKAW
jgi:hypothetical protein